jgi:crotonobetainyl-CoA:carnitine CoA-transferase CaiB-like acyl-CoA transferase
LLEQWAQDLTSAEAVSQLRAAGAIAEAVHPPDVVLEDPQLSYRNFFTPLTREPNGTHRYPTGWFHIEGGGSQPTPAPRLGEHNALLEGLLPGGSDVT